MAHGNFGNRLKRAFDLFVVLCALPLWLPVLLLVAFLVRIKLGSPVFFRQQRPGLHGAIFSMVKFRSMADWRDRDGKLLPDVARLTPLGRWLRSTSLDELPELWHVLRGEMSLVGPRPLLPQYLGRYNPRQARRHEVRPGITGLAQIKGRNALTWEEKFEWDVHYVETWSIGGDIRILFLTFWTVVFRVGINTRDGATMPEFNPGE